MSKRSRLTEYINPPAVTMEAAVLGNAINAGVSAVFDGVGKGISVLVKAMKGADKSPDPHNLVDEKGKSVYSSQWVERATKGIEDFWANAKWVSENLNTRDIQAAKLAVDLSYKGRVFSSPLEALKQQEKSVKAIFQQYRPGIAKYAQELERIEQQAQTMMSGKSPGEVTQWMLAEVGKVKRPLQPNFQGPGLVGGSVYLLDKDGFSSGYVRPDNYRANSTKLDGLDANTITATAKLIVQQLETIRTLWDAAPHAGSGCDTELWNWLSDEDDGVPEELYSEFYFQQQPDQQNDLLYYALMEWSETLHHVSKWVHSQLTQKEVSLEAADLSKYFDHDDHAASSDQRAALFGTCAGSAWRDRLIPLLTCAHFNPVVEDWNAEAQAQEELVKRTASAMVFVITPMQQGFYSFVEITDLAIKDPKRLYLCFLDNDEGHTWPKAQAASIEAIKSYLDKECGITLYDSLESLAEAVNQEVEPAKQHTEGDSVSQEGLFDSVKKLFSGHAKAQTVKVAKANGAPNPFVTLEKFDGYWVNRFREEILHTFGSRDWLTANFVNGRVTDATLANKLKLQGLLKRTPQEVLQTAEKICSTLAKNHHSRLEQYQRAIAAFRPRLDSLIGHGMSSEDNQAFLAGLRTEVDKLPKPISAGYRGPEFFGGFRGDMTDSGPEYVHKPAEPSAGELPSLTLNDVLGVAQLMITQMDTVIKSATAIPWPGIDTFDKGPWDRLDDPTRAGLTELLGMDGQPGEYHALIWTYHYEWGMLLQPVAQWLYATCQTTD